MDISRATNDRKLYLCKWYFRGILKEIYFVKKKFQQKIPTKISNKTF